MKTVLILVLGLALLAAAMFTRPDKRDLVLHVLDNQFGGDWSQHDIQQADDLVRGATFHNRILWTDVERNGKTLYTGVFGHWFGRTPETQKPLPSATQLAELARFVKP